MAVVHLLIAPFVALIDVLLGILAVLATALGGTRFFLVSGASPRYLLQRKRWYETTILGRSMRFRDYAQFAAWHAEVATRRWWR